MSLPERITKAGWIRMGYGHIDFAGEWPRDTLLGRLPPPARQAMLMAGVEVEQQGGQRIIREGDREDHVFLLVNGLVKVSASTEDGGEALLGIRAGGDLIGEMGVLERIPRSATVTTCVPLVTRVLYRNQLMDLLTRYPAIAVEIASMISWRLRWANRRRVEFAGNTPRTRVSRVILELASLYGHDNGSSWTLGVQLKQAEIASLASIKQRTVEKELHRLQDERIVDCRYRRVEVIDMAALRRIANGVRNPHTGGVP